MYKYLLDLIGFNADKPEDYYDRKFQLSTLQTYLFKVTVIPFISQNLTVIRPFPDYEHFQSNVSIF